MAQARQYDKARGARDIAYFARHAVPEWVCDDPPKVHRAIWDLLFDKEARYKYIIAPRHHSKTTCLKVAVLHDLAYAPTDFIGHTGIVAESGDQAEMILNDLKTTILDGTAYPHLFPHVARKGPSWGSDEIVTCRDDLIGAYGTRQRVRGRMHRGIRFRKLLFDDFESPETDSPLERKRIASWALAAAKYALHEPTGQIVFCGTMTFEDALLSRLHAAKNWIGLFLRAKYEDGDPHRELYGEDGMLWGDPHTNQDGDTVAFDRAWWDRMREAAIQEGELRLFNREIQNALTSNEEDFDPTKFVFYEDLKFDDGMVLVKPKNGDWRPVRVSLGVDSSTREHSDADWCVLMPVGMDQDRTVYQLPYVRQRYGKDVTRICNDIFELHSMYGFYRAGVETISAQAYIEGALHRQMPERNQWFTVVPHTPHRAKESRVWSMKPRVDVGKLQFHPSFNTELLDELSRYRSSRFKDCADALYMACAEARPWASTRPHRPEPRTTEYGYREPVSWDWMTESWLRGAA